MQSPNLKNNNSQNISENISLFNEIRNLSTESNNLSSFNIDKLETIDILKIINSEDKKVAIAVENELYNIANAVDNITLRFRNNGRLIYVGAGTSGRLGVVDASECPPTFGTDPEMVKAIIAGGKDAMYEAKEGVEDSMEMGKIALTELLINKNDVICGIAASGRTPFVLGAMQYAKELGCFVIFITTAEQNEFSKSIGLYDCLINPVIGAEVITGSTRMKSGTAQKMVLNMLTSASMVKLGKTYNNIMIDLQLKNAKLIERAKKTLMEICIIDYEQANFLLNESKGNVKLAIIMAKCKVDLDIATELISKANGFVKIAIEIYNNDLDK
jgi:N-acetylmuramic acid 6-phosphate etherase